MCLAGTYIATSGATSSSNCTPCRAPLISNASTGAIGCKPCQDGKTALINGSSVCVACRVGQYGAGGICSTCAAGFYAPAPGAIACTACPTGSYSTNTTGATTCVACPMATFGNTTGLSSCFVCTSPIVLHSLPSEVSLVSSSRVLYLWRNCERGVTVA